MGLGSWLGLLALSPCSASLKWKGFLFFSRYILSLCSRKDIYSSPLFFFCPKGHTISCAFMCTLVSVAGIFLSLLHCFLHNSFLSSVVISFKKSSLNAQTRSCSSVLWGVVQVLWEADMEKRIQVIGDLLGEALLQDEGQEWKGQEEAREPRE